MKFQEVFLLIIAELSLVIGAVLITLWFKPSEPTQLALGLVLVAGGVFVKYLEKKE